MWRCEKFRRIVKHEYQIKGDKEKMKEIYYETYMFIINFIKENRYPPTYREIAEELGYTLSTIACRIHKLVDLGKIEIKDKSPRSIKVVGYQFVVESKDKSRSVK